MTNSKLIPAAHILPTIAMVVDNEFYGDIRVYNEAKVLTKNGFKVKVYCFIYGQQAYYQEIDGIEVHRIKMNRKLKNILFGIVNTFPLYYWLWAFFLSKRLSSSDVHAIHAHDLYMAKPAGMVARHLKVPLVLDLHENYSEAVRGYRWANKFPHRLIVQPKKWAKVENRFLKMANRIVVLSDNFAEQLMLKNPSLSRSSFWIYPNVVDIEEMLAYRINPTNLNPQKNFNLLYFGGISERRGVYTCIEAIKILKEKINNIKLVLIGPIDGHEKEEFVKKTRDKSTENHILHIPWIDISELPSYVNDCQICLSPIIKNPQHDSGVANKVFQYMLFSKPLIVSNCTPQAQIVIEGECGLVFESDNAQDLAQKIMQLHQNSDLQYTYGINGKKLVLSKYNTDYYGLMLANNYRTFLNL